MVSLISSLNKLRIVLLLETLCFSILIVAFFPHISALGGSQMYLGSIMSAMSLVGIIWNPIIGSLGDTYGLKFILVKMIATCASSYFLLVISDSLVVIFLARVLAAFSGPIIPMTNTYASEILKKEEQSSYYSKLPAVMSVSFIVGSLLAGFLSEFNHGYKLCFLVMMSFNLINIGIIYTLPDTKAKSEKQQESLPLLEIAKREVKNAVVKLINVNWKEYSDIFAVKFCFELAFALFYRSLSPSFLTFGVIGRSMGYVFTFMSFCTIIANIVFVNLKKTTYSEDKFGSKRLYHSALMLFITSFILSFSNSVTFFASGLIPLAVARTFADSTFTEALLAKASEEHKGGVTGAFESITSFCGMVTPIAAGILNDLYGLKFTLIISMVPTGSSIFLANRLA